MAMTEFVNASTTLPTQQLYVNGGYVDATSGETFQTINPATNRVICEVQQASQADVDAAVVAAQAGFKVWSMMPAMERTRIMLRAVQILRERNDEIAHLETLDSGKPLSETTTVDIVSGADQLEYYAGLISMLHGQHFDFPPNGFASVQRQPLGVCAGIGAWNYPIQIAMWKSAPALACGNSFIFKPAELTPLTALKLAEIYTEAGLPDGVFNVVQGDYRVGQMLSRHEGIAKISLTGEVGTGKKVMADAATTLKGVTLELGGKSPIIVFDDADLDSAVSATLVANFYSAGEVCSNGTRVFVQRGLYEDVRREARAANGGVEDRRPVRPRGHGRPADQPRAPRQGHGLHERGAGQRGAPRLRRRRSQRRSTRRRQLRHAGDLRRLRRRHGVRQGRGVRAVDVGPSL